MSKATAIGTVEESGAGRFRLLVEATGVRRTLAVDWPGEAPEVGRRYLAKGELRLGWNALGADAIMVADSVVRFG